MADDKASIEIDTDRAQASLEDLGTAVERLISKMAKVGETSGIWDNVINKVNAFKLDPSVSAAFDNLNIKLRSLSVERIAELQAELSKLRPDQVKETADVLQKIQTLSGAINSNNISSLAGALKTAGAASFEATGGMDKLFTALKGAASGFLGVNTSVVNAAAGLGQIAGASATASAGLGQITAGMSGLGAAGAAIVGLGLAVVIYEIGRGLVSIAGPAVEASEAVIKFTSALNTVSKGNLGDVMFKSINDSALKTGISFGSVAQAAVKFGTAAQTAGLQASTITKTFENLSIGFRGAGLSSAEAGRAFTALEQMMSKGKIQAQELVIQLGNAVPGAMAIAAKAAGTTTAGLQQMAQAGQLLPTDFVVKFSEEMKKAFGNAFAEQLRTVTAQMNILGVAGEHLSQAFGGGNFIGIMRGFADALAGVNAVIQAVLPPLEGIARIIGDVFGAAFSLVGQVLKGFASALSDVVSGVRMAAVAFSEWINSNETVRSVLQGLGSVLSMVVSGFRSVAETVGYLGGIAAAAVAGWFALSAAFSAVVAIGGVIGSLFATLGGVITALGSGVATLAAGAVTLPGIIAAVGGAITGVITAITAANPLLLALGVVLGGVAAAFVLYGQEATNSTASSTGTAAAFQAVTAAAAESDDALRRLANGAGTVDGIMKQFAETSRLAKEQAQDLSREHRQLNESMNDMQRAVREANHGYDEQKNAIRANVEAVQMKIQRERESKQSLSELSHAQRDFGTATKDTTAANRQWASSIESTSNALQRQLAHLNEEMRAVEANSRAYQAHMNRQMDAMRDHQALLDKQREKLREQEEGFKRYGIILDDVTKDYVKQAEAAGIYDKEAGRLAATIKLVTMSEAELSAEYDKSIRKITDKLNAAQRLQDIAKRELAAYEEQAKAEGRANYQKEQGFIIRKQLADQMAQTTTKLETERIATEALKLVDTQHMDIKKAAAEAIKLYGDGVGDAAKVEEIAAKATEKLAERAKELSPATEKAAESTQKLGDAAKSADERQQEAADAAKKLADSLEKSVAKVDEGIGRFNALGIAVGTVATPMVTVADKMTAIVSAIGEMIAKKDDFDKFVVSVTSLGAAGERVKALGEGFDKVKESIAGLQQAADIAIPEIMKLTEASNGVATGFEKANTNIITFRDNLGTLHGPIDALIEKMNALKKAAEEALAAAQAAAAAQSQSSGGGDTTTDVAQQREGGYAGQMIDPMRVPSSVFSGAPSFAEGTANTNDLSRSVRGGGIPAILHANEAVVPLSRGRSIPVELSGGDSTTDIATAVTRGVTSSLGSLKSDVESMRDSYEVSAVSDNPAARGVGLQESAAVGYAMAATKNSPPPTTDGANPNAATPKSNQAPVTINMTINTPDADSFRKSKDQVHAEMFKKMRTAFNRNA